MKYTFAACMLLVLLLSGSFACAQGGIGNTPDPSGMTPRASTGVANGGFANAGDRSGVKADNATMILLALPAEIRSFILPHALLLQLTSQIALEKAVDPKVKTHAQGILDQRTLFSQQLKPFHSTNDVQTSIYKDVPGFTDTIKRLTSAKKGMDFDKQYIGSQMEIMEQLRIDLDAFLEQPVSPKENPQSRLWATNFSTAMKGAATDAHNIYLEMIKPVPALDAKPPVDAKP